MGWFTDDRSEREKNREKAFIEALNNLNSLTVTPDGGMSIDPMEIQDKIIKARLELKRYVK
ncbi:hypothetical protein [Pseudomonas fluorescens]|uniref:Uncharacterized protein n=1 Tax=Pseudomonas fluorescens TaxID=294 RepID=A0A5E7J077_PSEFL|nr:hypothetical protein [Pseudomonas fluorescens]VVO76743.1 hypothetical protein PS854_01586 [Pseudomonas fluorescens]